ncbi:NAD-dependent epimerase/dehydratase family protein [Jiangella ureilytica]|uniref:NAD-dependent epimerase/dehydratase family protein n=1 Tax=Jiangella ureilytica TaxID=2530374 RepID=A0A4R4REV1_9ACTN|nr:NAD-dependent epimerase/dehydratase family protein [Jiangella ureilytica]
MRVAIAGGHGQVARRLTRLLAARGDDIVGIVRNPGHVEDVRRVGGAAAVLDLEHAGIDEVVAPLAGRDAVVFSAGSGSSVTAARRKKVDKDAVALVLDAAERGGVRRFLHVSSINVGCAESPGIGEGYADYLRAKHAAEQDVFAREGLAWTVLRPGVLTDDQGSGTVDLVAGGRIAPESPRFDTVSRDDVAAVLLALLDRPDTAGRIYVVVGGTIPIGRAIDIA